MYAIMLKILYYLILLSLILSCNETERIDNFTDIQHSKDSIFYENKDSIDFELELSFKSIHVIVALCDNKYQGIVPVSSNLGNGQDPKNNLYWGTAYGIKTYFNNSEEWSLLKVEKMDSIILERLIFKHQTKDFYLIADAYNGKFIKLATETFLRSSAGMSKDTVHFGDSIIGIEGNAQLLSYIGHDGLMDFSINEQFINSDKKVRDVIILSCYSKNYFKNHLLNANVNPLVWTTGLMAPEAYTIHDALTGYVNGEKNEEIRIRAANAYNKYQKCGINGALNLLVTE